MKLLNVQYAGDLRMEELRLKKNLVFGMVELCPNHGVESVGGRSCRYGECLYEEDYPRCYYSPQCPIEED